MNRVKVGWALAGGVAAVVLFGALWKAAAPVRIRQQFEAQALAQLENTTAVNGSRFNSIRVTSFRYNPTTDVYEVQYELKYGDLGLYSTWSSCSLARRDGAFQSECMTAPSSPSSPPATFSVSLSD